MKAITCRDIISCDFITKGDTTKEIYKNIAEHVKYKHRKFWYLIKNIPELDMEKEIVNKIKEVS